MGVPFWVYGLPRSITLALALWVWDNESGYNSPISFLIEDLG